MPRLLEVIAGQVVCSNCRFDPDVCVCGRYAS